MSIAALTVRTWLRYLAPLTVLSVLATSVLLWLALHVPPAQDAAAARVQLRFGWGLVGVAAILQLLLVAGVAPATRSLAARKPLSQLRALLAGMRSLVQAVIPIAIATLAIAIGGVALAIPGLLLLVLLAMTGASERIAEPLPAPLLDSIAVARGQLLRVAIVVALVVVLDAAVAAAAHLAIVHPLPKTPSADALHATRAFVRTIAVALVVLSPLPACALAATYQRTR